ncbi:hypothetical protein OAG75_01150 [bacterium]|nr:hypothetical protein [bacterium]
MIEILTGSALGAWAASHVVSMLVTHLGGELFAWKNKKSADQELLQWLDPDAVEQARSKMSGETSGSSAHPTP